MRPSLCICNTVSSQIISEQYPESLLILDDVWSSDVISAFAECCPIMVTSRNARMAKMYNCYDVDICDGLLSPHCAWWPSQD